MTSPVAPAGEMPPARGSGSSRRNRGDTFGAKKPRPRRMWVRRIVLPLHERRLEHALQRWWKAIFELFGSTSNASMAPIKLNSSGWFTTNAISV